MTLTESGEAQAAQGSVLTGMIKEVVIEELQDILNWLKTHEERDYWPLKKELAIAQERAHKLSKECELLSKSLGNLKVQKKILQTVRDNYEEEAKMEWERNRIAY